jgi:hypothetical protein
MRRIELVLSIAALASAAFPLVSQQSVPHQPAEPALALEAAECRIRGRITLRDTGEPVPGVFVGLVYTMYSDDGVPESAFLDHRRTDEHGEYYMSGRRRSLFHVATGVFATTGRSYLPVEIPLVRPSCREETRVEITVSEAHPVTVAGDFIDGTGHRYPHLDWVYLQPKDTLSPPPIPEGVSNGRNWQNRYRNAAGYRIEGVLPGSYYLKSDRFDEIAERVQSVIPIEVRDKDLKVDIVSDIAHRVTGSIHFQTERFPVIEKNDFEIKLLPVGPSRWNFPSSAIIKRDGTFGFSDVHDGRYRLSFRNIPVPFYVRSVRQGMVDVLHDGIAVPGRTAASMVVVIAADGGRITGAVEGAENANRPATVVLIPTRAGIMRSDLYRVAAVDSNGHFQIGGIAPGRYEIYAWPAEDIQRNDYFDHEFLEHFQGRSTSVQVGSHSDLHVMLKVLENDN